jgi:hypothetical protein
MLWLITDQVCLFVYLLVYVVGWVPVRPLTDYGQVFIAITLPRSDKPTGPRREQSNNLCPTPKSTDGIVRQTTCCPAHTKYHASGS